MGTIPEPGPIRSGGSGWFSYGLNGQKCRIDYVLGSRKKKEKNGCLICRFSYNARWFLCMWIG
jgi:hypothetical protein